MAHFRFRRSFGNVGTRRFRGARPLGSTPAFSPEATNYFSRLDAAGDTTYVDYKQPLANYIDSLVSLGGAYWDTMESSTSFVGVGIQGVTVPLRNGMTVPTNNNFVADDLNQLTGLKSNGSTKYIDTGLVGTDLTLNDASWSCNITVAGSYIGVDYPMGSGVNESGAMNFLSVNGVNMESRMQAQARSIIYTGSVLNKTGFLGVSRSSSAAFDWQFDSVGGTNAVASNSTAPTSAFSVFGASNFVSNDNRLATYHVGPALNLATLEGLQETLLSEVAAAKGAAAAANYFARLDTAGDTTYVPYKQPLTNYISSLVALGGAYWENMESSASFVGVGIQGVTVPLKDGVPALTNNNFVAGDLLQTTGLKGDALTKYFDLNVLGSVVEQDNASISVYITEADGAFGFHMGHQGNRLTLRNNPYVELNGAAAVPTNGKPTSKIFGGSRTTSTDVDVRNNQVNSTISNTSSSTSGSTMFLFARVNSASSKARLATYHIGSALDLATLEGLQDTLLAEIAGIGFSTEAANYFSRLVNAGDTTFLAYRQPLANYIDSLVALGGAYWDDMKSAASFVGVGIQGVTVPLRDGMPSITNNNFVAGDLDQLTGLKGDASTKWLNTGLSSTVMSLNDTSISVYTTVDSTDINYWLLGNNLFTALRSKGTTFVNGPTAGSTTAVSPTLYGGKRSTSTHVDVRVNGTTSNFANTSSSIGTENYNLFTYAPGSGSSDARLATYHIGPALNLATLRSTARHPHL